MKSLLTIAATLILAISTSFGVEYDDYKTWSYGVKGGVNVTQYNGSRFRPFVGVLGEARFQFLGFSAEVQYSRETRLDNDTPYESGVINIPINFNFYVFKGLAVKFGVQPAVDIRRQASGRINTVLTIPLGVSYDFKFGLILDARYNMGEENRFAQFSVGYRF